jgi:hypothetical protein
MEATDHALHRLLERQPGADLDAVLLSAHRHVLRCRLHRLSAA